MRALPTDIGYDYRPFRVANRENITLAGWWIPTARCSGTVLMAHSVGMNKSHMQSRAKVVLEAEFNVMLIDLRARGESGGRMNSPGVKEPADVLVGESDRGITYEEAKALRETSHHCASAVHVFSNTGHAVFTPENREGYVGIVQTFLRTVVEQRCRD